MTSGEASDPIDDAEVGWEERSTGPPVLRLTLPRRLDAPCVERSAARAQAAAGREGEGFALLIDTRKVERASVGALEALRRLEAWAARSGRLTRLAHLVRDRATARRNAERLERAGFSGLFCDFATEKEALSYLSGLTASSSESIR